MNVLQRAHPFFVEASSQQYVEVRDERRLELKNPLYRSAEIVAGFERPIYHKSQRRHERHKRVRLPLLLLPYIHLPERHARLANEKVFFPVEDNSHPRTLMDDPIPEFPQVGKKAPAPDLTFGQRRR
jgi:hypothetical protein